MKKTKNSTNKNENIKDIQKDNKVIIHISDRESDE